MRLPTWINRRFRKQHRRQPKFNPVLLDSFKERNGSAAAPASSPEAAEKNSSSASADNGKPRPKPPTPKCEFISQVQLLPCETHTQEYDDYERNGTLDVTEIVLALLLLYQWAKRGISRALGLHNSVLLTGAPGTGKTTSVWLAANRFAVLSQQSVVAIAVETHKLASGQRGGTQQNVLRLFEHIREAAAAGYVVIVIVNEIESLLPNRGSVSTDTNPMDTIFAVNAFLEKFDELPPNVFLVATSNFTQLIDAAASDRFDLKRCVPLPGDEARLRLLARTVARVNPQAESLTALASVGAEKPSPEVQQLLRLTHGFSIRALTDVVFQAALQSGGDETLSLDQLLLGADEVGKNHARN